VIDWLLIVLPGVIWGASFLFIAEGLTAVPPDGVTFIRIAIGFLTLSTVPGARKPIVRSDWKGVAALGLLWFAFPMSMFPHAEQWISSALTGMLNGTVPLFATAVAAVLHRKMPSSMVAVGIAAGLFGGVLMAWPGMGAGGSSALGIVLVIAACISYGFAVNLARPLQQRNGALPVVWRALLVALILTAPLGLPRALHGHWTPRSVLSLLALGALGTCVANVMTTIAAGLFHPGRGAAPGRARPQRARRADLADRRGDQPGRRLDRALGVDARGRGRGDAGGGGRRDAAPGEISG
jgi:drug/metabolite transporter (DMT)-like permease